MAGEGEQLVLELWTGGIGGLQKERGRKAPFFMADRMIEE